MEAENKIAQRLVLRDTHPTMVKILKMYDLAEELGISFNFSAGRCWVNDTDRDDKLPTLYIEDIEQYHDVDCFPPATEFKVVYDNPAYLAEEKRKWDERKAKEQVELAIKLAKVKEEEELKLQEQQRQQAVRDRKEYERLKAQFG